MQPFITSWKLLIVYLKQLFRTICESWYSYVSVMCTKLEKASDFLYVQKQKKATALETKTKRPINSLRASESALETCPNIILFSLFISFIIRQLMFCLANHCCFILSASSLSIVSRLCSRSNTALTEGLVLLTAQYQNHLYCQPPFLLTSRWSQLTFHLCAPHTGPDSVNDTCIWMSHHWQSAGQIH